MVATTTHADFTPPSAETANLKARGHIRDDNSQSRLLDKGAL